MANTSRTAEIEQAWAERPDLDPLNVEDAWYIVCHPREDYSEAARQNGLTVQQFLIAARGTYEAAVD